MSLQAASLHRYLLSATHHGSKTGERASDIAQQRQQRAVAAGCAAQQGERSSKARTWFQTLVSFVSRWRTENPCAPHSQYIKDPGQDPVIAMQRLRRARDLDIASQKRSVSGISGGTLHAQLQLKNIEKEIRELEEVASTMMFQVVRS